MKAQHNLRIQHSVPRWGSPCLCTHMTSRLRPDQNHPAAGCYAHARPKPQAASPLGRITLRTPCGRAHLPRLPCGHAHL